MTDIAQMEPSSKSKRGIIIAIIIALVVLCLCVCAYLFLGKGSAQTPPPAPPIAATPVPAKPKVVVPVRTPDSISDNVDGVPGITIQWPAGTAPSKRDQNYWERCGKQKGERC